jgi:hypothetical protein
MIPGIVFDVVIGDFRTTAQVVDEELIVQFTIEAGLSNPVRAIFVKEGDGWHFIKSDPPNSTVFEQKTYNLAEIEDETRLWLNVANTREINKDKES